MPFVFVMAYPRAILGAEQVLPPARPEYEKSLMSMHCRFAYQLFVPNQTVPTLCLRGNALFQDAGSLPVKIPNQVLSEHSVALGLFDGSALVSR